MAKNLPNLMKKYNPMDPRNAMTPKYGRHSKEYTVELLKVTGKEKMLQTIKQK